MRWLLTVILVLGLALFGMACQEEKEDESEAAASPIATATLDRAELESLLKSMALRLEDLPSGFILEEEKFTTNEEAAKDYPDGEEQGLANFARWGRLLRYEATYSTEASLATLMTGGTLGILVDTALFEDPNGASEAWTWAADRWYDPEEMASFIEEFKEEDPAWEEVEFAPMSFPQVGENTAAFQVTGEVSDSESGLEARAVVQFAVVRRGRGIGMLAVTAIQGTSPIEELEAMARKLDQRMKEALE